MGIQMSSIRDILRDQQLSDWCLPITSYVPFPKTQWTVGEDGLLTDIHILPDNLQRSPDNGHLFWWSDAQFVPFKDTHLFASTSAFQPRPTHQWILAPQMPNGRVLLYHMTSSERIQCNAFSRTNSTVFPKMTPHPIGQMVSYCGTGEVAVMTINGDPVYSRSRDLSNAVHVYCAIANNGVSFACLKRGMGTFFLECCTLDVIMLGNYSIRCHHVCPGFVPLKTSPDIVACKFSPDGKFIAVSRNKDALFVVTRSKLEKLCILCPGVVEGNLSSAEAFDFHPHFAYEVMTLATTENILQTVNIESGKILLSTEIAEIVDCVKYSKDGLLVAVGLHNFDICIYDSQELSCTQTLYMSSLCLNAIQRVQVHYPAVLNVSFSQNGEFLASSSCDGHLRLWRIFRVLSLQAICRDKILTCLPVKDVKKLKDIPEKMQNFLLYKYF